MSKSKKNLRMPSVLSLMLVVLGILLVGYPSISNAYYRLTEANVSTASQAVVEQTDDSTLEQELALCKKYNETIASGHAVLTDPFQEDSQRVTNAEYEARLNLSGNGVMATIDIPSIDVSLPLYHTSSDDVLQHGIGHIESSSLPTGGASSHCVIAGHNGLSSMVVFDDLEKVQKDDYIFVSVAGETHAYMVYSIEVVEPDDTRSLIIQPKRDLMTLITCTPHGINTHRLLVHAERTEVPDWWNQQAQDENRQAAIDYSIPAAVAAIAGALVLIIAYVAVRIYSAHKKRVNPHVQA